jgi:RNA polymerase sigma-70 factor (ECF subfamily)
MAQTTFEQDEAATIFRAVSGDETAQRTLYETHYAPAYRLAYLLLQDACDAEEVVQDAFVYVLRNLRRYDAERGSFWGWLRITLVSRCRNKRRRRQLPSISLDVLDAAERSPADPELANDPVGMLELRGAQRAMWEALQEVSPGARDALILRYYGGVPYAEIATLLGCSPDAARARVAHGKVQLRRILTRTLADTGEGMPRVITLKARG